jgi:hypothetical protein
MPTQNNEGTGRPDPIVLYEVTELHRAKERKLPGVTGVPPNNPPKESSPEQKQQQNESEFGFGMGGGDGGGNLLAHPLLEESQALAGVDPAEKVTYENPEAQQKAEQLLLQKKLQLQNAHRLAATMKPAGA